MVPRRPLLAPSDVLHGATSRSAPVAPGEIVGLIGSGLGPFEPTDAAEGLTVTLDEFPAPVLAAEDTLLVVQVPFEIAGREQAVLRLRYADLDAEEVQLEVAAASPGVLRRVVNADGRTNSPGNPAARGTSLTLSGTGQGVLDPPLSTGQPTPSGDAIQLRDVSATFDGIPATVRSAAMVPGQIGVFRIEVTVPADAPEGSSVPLRITMRGSDRAAEVPVAIR
jgi:uncharacterized protein (TIGR03437 family)